MAVSKPPQGESPAQHAEDSDVQAPEELSFEEALMQLESVVSALEEGQVPLERSLLLLERGLGLAKRCESTLTQAELALKQLMISPDGELVTQDMETSGM